MGEAIKSDVSNISNVSPNVSSDCIIDPTKHIMDDILSPDFDWKIKINSRFNLKILNINVILTKFSKISNITKVFLMYNNKEIWWYLLNEKWNNVMTKNYEWEECFVIDYFKDENEEMYFLKRRNLKEIWWIGKNALK